MTTVTPTASIDWGTIRNVEYVDAVAHSYVSYTSEESYANGDNVTISVRPNGTYWVSTIDGNYIVDREWLEDTIEEAIKIKELPITDEELEDVFGAYIPP